MKVHVILLFVGRVMDLDDFFLIDGDKVSHDFWNSRRKLDDSDFCFFPLPIPHPVISHHKKVMLCQRTYGGGLSQVKEALSKEQSFSGRIPDTLIFPEGFIPQAGEVDATKDPVKKLCSFNASCGVPVIVWGTMMEKSANSTYITCVVTNNKGELVGKYRKRCLTYVGVVEKGEKSCLFPTESLGPISVLICFGNSLAISLSSFLCCC